MTIEAFDNKNIEENKKSSKVIQHDEEEGSK